MIRIGCRAHDYGRHTPAALADTLHAHGYTAAQLAMHRKPRCCETRCCCPMTQPMLHF